MKEIKQDGGRRRDQLSVFYVIFKCVKYKKFLVEEEKLYVSKSYKSSDKRNEYLSDVRRRVGSVKTGGAGTVRGHHICVTVFILPNQSSMSKSLCDYLRRLALYKVSFE